jgi:hypothetical protein
METAFKVFYGPMWPGKVRIRVIRSFAPLAIGSPSACEVLLDEQLKIKLRGDFEYNQI